MAQSQVVSFQNSGRFLTNNTNIITIKLHTTNNEKYVHIVFNSFKRILNVFRIFFTSLSSYSFRIILFFSHQMFDKVSVRAVLICAPLLDFVGRTRI